jgi:ion channel-forming bestrophin family protein
MKIGKSYTFFEFLAWTRRRLYVLLVLALVPVLLYRLLGQTWAAVPWSVALLLGTAASFIVGFKNAQTYQRTLEAQQVWAAIAATSRYWGTICRDFPTHARHTRTLVLRHLAWLTVLRYQLRVPKVWETVNHGANAEYRARRYRVPEIDTPKQAELKRFVPEDELPGLATAPNPTLQLLSAQSLTLRDLYGQQQLAVLHHTEMEKTLKDLMEQQSRAERIKNFPYPRQYAAINRLFIWSFAAVLPFAMVREFDRLNDGVSGLMAGHMVWLAVPFSMLVGWMYLALDLVGESTENPFEGGANDVPISQLSRQVEIELLHLPGDSELRAPLQAHHDIVL